MNINSSFEIRSPQNTHTPALRTLWQETFGDTDEFIDSFFTTAYHPNRCRLVLAEEKVVAMLYWFYCLYNEKPIAYLYAIATENAYRGQGICRKLMSDTHKHLSQSGYQGTILVPGSRNLFDFYKKQGYETCSFLQEFSCKASNNLITVSKITKEKYSQLRRQFLPIGGVIQEKENLDFLQTQAEFFTGENFVLAARKEGSCLIGIELLGETSIAPKLVHSLGCQNGTFRCPGKKIPFAMYHPLNDYGFTLPDYFGLAFD